MTPRLEFVVYGKPGPQGSKSFKGMRGKKGGKQHAVLVESSKFVKPWREAVKAAGIDAMRESGLPVFDGDLIARMVFTVAKPTGAPKKRRTRPNKKPDLSKLLRATEDALTDAGVIFDDARLVEFSRLVKVFPGEDPEALHVPGVLIVIAHLPS